MYAHSLSRSCSVTSCYGRPDCAVDCGRLNIYENRCLNRRLAMIFEENRYINSKQDSRGMEQRKKNFYPPPE